MKDILQLKTFYGLLLTTFLVVNVFLSAAAQVFPIQTSVQLATPYSPYLSDYTAPGSQRLTVQLRTNDINLGDHIVKLRITIEGVGITLRTKQNLILPQIPIQGGGIPMQLYGEDLIEYFNPANIDFAGLSRQEFEKTGRLPEGVYRFSVEVLDYNRNFVLSNKGMTVAWIILNDPPLLNMPRKETKVRILDPTNIPFTWTPRHTSSPNSAFSTEYIFRLVEIWPASRNPYDAFLSQPVLYEEITSQSQIIYGIAEPALIPGRKYAWQVQARDVDGRDLFKNQGRSEVFVFQFGDALTPPVNLRQQSANPSTITIRWDPPSSSGTSNIKYKVRYRPVKNKFSNEWYYAPPVGEDQWKAIPFLNPGTEYEFQVRAEEQFQVSEYTTTQIYKTLPRGADEFVCGDDIPPKAPSASSPLIELSINDTLRAGNFDVLVRNVTGGTGTYTGEGFVIVPYFKGAKVRVTFENIRVNEQFQLTSGEVKTFWNPDSKFLVNVKTPTAPGQVAQAGEVPVTIAATESLIEIKGAAIVTLSKDDEGDIIVHTTDGGKRELKKGESYSVVDDVGNGYVIDKEGNIAKTTAAEARAASERGNRNYSLKLRFDKGEGKFGFDEKKYDALSQNYQQVDGGKFIAWKAVTFSQPDLVTVIPESGTPDTNKIRFEINSSPIQPQAGSGTIKLNLQGKAQGMVEELIAVTGESGSEEEVLGKLNLVSYDQLSRNLVIVPVNSARPPSGLSESTLNTELTKIFQQAVTNWRVSVATKIDVKLDAQFDDGESGLLSNYTSDMKKVINTFGRLQDNTYYLFLVEKPKSGSHALGYMPRSKQAGFIFVDNHNNDGDRLVRTIAHELGHGAFNLKHTFSEYAALGEGVTENLMDYSNGTELLKYQWDYMHDPQRVIPLFEGDEEGEMTSWSGTLVDEQHTELFDHIYANNHIGELRYLTEIERLLTDDPSKQILELNYDDNDDHKAWVNSWKIRVVNYETVLNNTIKVIQEAKKGEKLGKIYLRSNHIYIAKHKYNNRDYPIAIYNAGTSEVMENVFTKVEITDMDQLDEEDNKKRVYIEETFYSYFVIAFYEEGKKIPTLMVQVEKFPFSDLLNNSMEEWLKFLKILVKEETGDNDEHTEALKQAGEKRVQNAIAMNTADTRLYRQVIEANGRLNDDYVDCAEFVYDILKQESITSPSGDCVAQFAWYKSQEYDWGTSVNDIKKGDILLWDDPDDSADPEKTLNHTGFAIQDYNNGNIPIIHSGLNGCYCGSYSYPVYEKDINGNIKFNDDSTKVVKYETVADCDQVCIDKNKFSVTQLNDYIKSGGNTQDGDLIFKYWVRPKEE